MFHTIDKSKSLTLYKPLDVPTIQCTKILLIDPQPYNFKILELKYKNVKHL